MTTTQERIDELQERPSRTPRREGLWAIGVAWYLVVAWLLVQRGLVDWLSDNPALNFYLVQPLLWLGLAAVSYLGWRRLSDRPPFSRILTGIAALLGAFHVGFFVLGGVIFGFGDSYVAGQIANYPRNLWFIGTWLLGLEMARTFIFHAWRPFNERWAFVGAAGILALAMTPYGQLSSLARSGTALNTLGGFIVPTVVLSILLTWLVDHGGLGPSMGYWAPLLGFEWFSQIQPDLDWPVLLLIGTAAPVLSANLIRSIYLDTEEGASRWADVGDLEDEGDHQESRNLSWSLLVTAALMVALVLGGVLGYRPVVVTGISMEPAYERGDMAIIDRDFDPATLAVGDVVEFHDPNGRSVIHRIVAIEENPAGLLFTTQGDNNGRPDPPLTTEVIDGKVIFLFPILGWPAIWLRGA